MFLICDHYEPRHGITHEGQDSNRVAAWFTGYPALFEKCRKEFGHGPKHTWFYPPHHGLEHLEALSEMAFNGLGEVELHFHHDGDTSFTLREKLRECVNAYNRRGLLLSSGDNVKTTFAFIHGDWALDNSADGKYCGVNDELTILRELGCWGDFTMPSANECQTRKINSIYYAQDNPNKPKSHDHGIDLVVGKAAVQNSLFMMQGPLGINFRAPRYPRIENAALTTQNWGREDRTRAWVDLGIHVQGRPEWIFVKLHAHGAVEVDHDALIGERAFEMHRVLNEKYNDGRKYRLHYVTEREAYNICKAAEQGLEGDPDDYRDLVIPPYASRRYILNDEHLLVSCTDRELYIKDINDSERCCIKLSGMAIREISGRLEQIELNKCGQDLGVQCHGTSEVVTLHVVEGVKVQELENAALVAHEQIPGGMKYTIRIEGNKFHVRLKQFVDKSAGPRDAQQMHAG
jgi:hypothetical protein